MAAPEDAHTEEVIDRCMREGIADFVLFARREKAETAERIAAVCPGHAVTVTADTPEETARMAVKAVREGQADVLMKGTLNTDVLLRAVLDKENGLLIPGRTLSHITATQIPQYGKLLLFADAAVIPHPDTEQFDAILRYALNIFRKLNGHGRTPRVALIHCTEKTNAKFAHTLSYAELRRRAAEGRYGRMLLDGPMDVKTACDSVIPYLEEGWGTVGTKVEISHVAATPIGMTVRCESELTLVDGRRLEFTVKAYDDAGLIGEGTHERFLVNNEKFQKKADAKLEK